MKKELAAPPFDKLQEGGVQSALLPFKIRWEIFHIIAFLYFVEESKLVVNMALCSKSFLKCAPCFASLSMEKSEFIFSLVADFWDDAIAVDNVK